MAIGNISGPSADFTPAPADLPDDSAPIEDSAGPDLDGGQGLADSDLDSAPPTDTQDVSQVSQEALDSEDAQPFSLVDSPNNAEHVDALSNVFSAPPSAEEAEAAQESDQGDKNSPVEKSDTTGQQARSENASPANSTASAQTRTQRGDSSRPATQTSGSCATISRSRSTNCGTPSVQVRTQKVESLKEDVSRLETLKNNTIKVDDSGSPSSAVDASQWDTLKSEVDKLEANKTESLSQETPASSPTRLDAIKTQAEKLDSVKADMAQVESQKDSSPNETDASPAKQADSQSVSARPEASTGIVQGLLDTYRSATSLWQKAPDTRFPGDVEGVAAPSQAAAAPSEAPVASSQKGTDGPQQAPQSQTSERPEVVRPEVVASNSAPKSLSPWENSNLRAMRTLGPMTERPAPASRNACSEAEKTAAPVEAARVQPLQGLIMPTEARPLPARPDTRVPGDQPNTARATEFSPVSKEKSDSTNSQGKEDEKSSLTNPLASLFGGEGPAHLMERLQSLQSLSQKFQLSFGKQDGLRPAPQTPPPPGQTGGSSKAAEVVADKSSNANDSKPVGIVDNLSSLASSAWNRLTGSEEGKTHQQATSAGQEKSTQGEPSDLRSTLGSWATSAYNWATGKSTQVDNKVDAKVDTAKADSNKVDSNKVGQNSSQGLMGTLGSWATSAYNWATGKGTQTDTKINAVNSTGQNSSTGLMGTLGSWATSAYNWATGKSGETSLTGTNGSSTGLMGTLGSWATSAYNWATGKSGETSLTGTNGSNGSSTGLMGTLGSWATSAYNWATGKSTNGAGGEVPGVNSSTPSVFQSIGSWAASASTGLLGSAGKGEVPVANSGTPTVFNSLSSWASSMANAALSQHDGSQASAGAFQTLRSLADSAATDPTSPDVLNRLNTWATAASRSLEASVTSEPSPSQRATSVAKDPIEPAQESTLMGASSTGSFGVSTASSLSARLGVSPVADVSSAMLTSDRGAGRIPAGSPSPTVALESNAGGALLASPSQSRSSVGSASNLSGAGLVPGLSGSSSTSLQSKGSGSSSTYLVSGRFSGGQESEKQAPPSSTAETRQAVPTPSARSGHDSTFAATTRSSQGMLGSDVSDPRSWAGPSRQPLDRSKNVQAVNSNWASPAASSAQANLQVQRGHIPVPSEAAHTAKLHQNPQSGSEVDMVPIERRAPGRPMSALSSTRQDQQHDSQRSNQAYDNESRAHSKHEEKEEASHSSRSQKSHESETQRKQHQAQQHRHTQQQRRLSFAGMAKKSAQPNRQKSASKTAEEHRGVEAEGHTACGRCGYKLELEGASCPVCARREQEMDSQVA